MVSSPRNAIRTVALLALPTAAFAASAPAATGSFGPWTMVMGLLGGLALFLYGMEQMSDGLKALAGDRLRDILARLTSNRVMGALTGAGVTAIIQSSSVTTVLTVGFTTAGILTLPQAVGIIFGANVGTTFTAQIIAFQVSKLSLLMIAAGFALLFLSSGDRNRHYGEMLMGLGLVFFGMGVMSDAMAPLRSYAPFLDLMVHMANPLVGILVAALFTGLVQSSSATTGVVIVMASQGLITLHAGIALIFGANIGTCVTAMLASLGKPRPALQASLVHVLFNVIGVLLWVGFIDQLVWLVAHLSPAAEHLEGAHRLAEETPRQIANAHSIFNVANTLILLPFAGPFGRLVRWLAPEHEAATDVSPAVTEVRLDPALLTMPAIALDQARGELLTLGRLLHQMLKELVPAFIEDDAEAAAAIATRAPVAREMKHRIDDFLIQLSRRNLSEEQSSFASQLLDIGASLHHLESVVRKDLVPLLERKRQLASDDRFGVEELSTYSEEVLDDLETALDALDASNPERARRVLRARGELEEHLRQTRALHYDRLQDPTSAAGTLSGLHLDLLDDLRRIFIHAETMALTMLSGYLGERRQRRAGE